MEVGADVVGEFLDAVEEGLDRVVHLVGGGDDLVGEGAFEVGVDQFVWVEVRGVGGQVVQFDLLGVFGYPGADSLGAVDGVAVENELDLLVVLTQQPGQELEERPGVGPALTIVKCRSPWVEMVDRSTDPAANKARKEAELAAATAEQ